MEKEKVKQQVLEAYGFRHACKLFDASKKIDEADMDYLLETGRLSPTSFGMQGVRMIVITDDALRAKLKPACWNQNQIDSSSHLVVFTTRTQDLVPGSDWVKSRFADRGMPIEAQEAYYTRYAGFHQSLKDQIAGYFSRSFVNLFYNIFHHGRNAQDIYHWGAKQCYILMGNMMTAAAMIGIDSCPLEGFEKNKVEGILELDTQKEEVVLICAFGYRQNDQPQKRRLPIGEISERR